MLSDSVARCKRRDVEVMEVLERVGFESHKLGGGVASEASLQA